MKWGELLTFLQGDPATAHLWLAAARARYRNSVEEINLDDIRRMLNESYSAGHATAVAIIAAAGTAKK